jgi:hypothetical protein
MYLQNWINGHCDGRGPDFESEEEMCRYYDVFSVDELFTPRCTVEPGYLIPVDVGEGGNE